MIGAALGIIGLIGSIGFLIAGAMNAEHDYDRPWAGVHTRTRDGKTQTYYSKGRARITARIPKWAQRASLFCSLLFFVSLFIRF